MRYQIFFSPSTIIVWFIYYYLCFYLLLLRLIDRKTSILLLSYIKLGIRAESIPNCHQNPHTYFQSPSSIATNLRRASSEFSTTPIKLQQTRFNLIKPRFGRIKQLVIFGSQILSKSFQYWVLIATLCLHRRDKVPTSNPNTTRHPWDLLSRTRNPI